MKLNHDCVRDVLLFVEEHASYDGYIAVDSSDLPSYSDETIIYAVDKLVEADYLNGKAHKDVVSVMPTISISSMTWSGHQFLDNIRDDSVWKDTKNILSKFSSVSLGIVNNVASQIISSLVRAQLGL